MKNHTRKSTWREILWRPSVTLVGLFFAIIPALTWIRDEFLSPDKQERWKIPKLLPHWHWWAWAVVGLSVLLFTVLESAYRVIHRQEIESEKRIELLRSEIGQVNTSKPTIEYQFSYGGQLAAILVTNRGAIADVWASLRIDGLVNGRRDNIFGRWAHAESVRARIAKGQTCQLILAVLNMDSGMLVATWDVLYTFDGGISVSRACHSSLVGNRDAQAQDINLYIDLFSDPDSTNVPSQCHVVLRATKAERLGG